MRERRQRERKQKDRKRGKDDRRGVALIMVLVITTILSAIAVDLSNESKVNLRAAANARDQLQAHFHAQSAIELELFFLRFQSLLKGTLSNFIPIPLFEMSSFLVSSDTMKGILDRKGPRPDNTRTRGSFALDHAFGDFEGSFWIEEVVDEGRKININRESPTNCGNLAHILIAAAIDDPKYDKLFETLGDTRDPIRSRLEIIANMTDWVDGNEVVDTVCTITGDTAPNSTSEDTRYDHLPYGASYKPKNGQMSSLAELRMVPGVNDAFMRLFSRYLTVWSDNTGISMNTADAWMLRAVVRAVSPPGPPRPGDEERIQKFLEQRELLRAFPPPLNQLSKQKFVELLNAQELLVDPARLKQLEGNLRFDDVTSVYRITARGRVENALSTITLVWRDNPRPQGEMFYWRED